MGYALIAFLSSKEVIIDSIAAKFAAKRGLKTLFIEKEEHPVKKLVLEFNIHMLLF